MADKTPKQPFVSQADRPEVRLKSDTPLNELTVRDLATILGQLGTRKDFWDGKDWQKDDFDGTNKPWKEGKEIKDKDKEKEKEKEGKEKREKLEKPEIKELKLEKLESDGVFEPVTLPGPDPRIDQVIQALSGLSARVAQLANQVEELKKASKG
jgi:hypothetical protein